MNQLLQFSYSINKDEIGLDGIHITREEYDDFVDLNGLPLHNPMLMRHKNILELEIDRTGVITAYLLGTAKEAEVRLISDLATFRLSADSGFDRAGMAFGSNIPSWTIEIDDGESAEPDTICISTEIDSVRYVQWLHLLILRLGLGSLLGVKPLGHL